MVSSLPGVEVCMLGYGLKYGLGVGIVFVMKSEALRDQLWFGSILGAPGPWHNLVSSDIDTRI
jgi:hypothetical protein